MNRRLYLRIAGLAVALAAHATAFSAPAPSPSAPDLIATPRPLVIAHRGWSGVTPENTLPSFQLALHAAPDLVELDYHHSADGVPVVIHDTTLTRTTDAAKRWPGGDMRVAARPLAELQTLDAGAWFHPRYAGTAVPTLTEALDAIRPTGATLIERKAGDAPTLARLLTDQQLVNRVVVQSFDWEFLRALRAELPGQVLGALGPHWRSDGRPMTDEDKILGPAHLDAIVAVGAQVAVWSRDINAASVAAAHARGLKVWVYTVDDPAEMRRLFALGIDGIITNQPALAWSALATPQTASTP